MAKYKLDENTRRKRQKRFGSKYPDKILKMQKEKHINGIKLISRIRKGMGKIEGKFSKLNSREVILRQALFLSRQSSLLTDAIIDAKYGIKKFEAIEFKKRNEIWQEEYSKTVEALFNLPELKKIKGLSRQLTGLNNYFNLPQGIHNARNRHWKLIKKVEEKIQRNGITPSQNFQAEIDRIITKSKTGQNIKVKAMDICVAASIYADLMTQREQKSWTIHYRAAMEIAYEKLRKKPEIIDMIIKLK